MAWPGTPLGPLWGEVNDKGTLLSLRWGKAPKNVVPVKNTQVQKSIEAYFKKPSGLLDVQVELDGTPYQKKIWAAVRQIEPGTVLSYGELARMHQSGPRAIARAMASNRIPLVIPCHRVVGANGGMGGYSGMGGLETKKWLLKHEGAL